MTMHGSDGDSVLVDVDGTLAVFDPEAVREWVLVPQKNWPAFFDHMREAPAFQEVLRLVRILQAAGNRIVICTGRPEAFRAETKAWLELHEVPCDALYLRHPDDDSLDDEIAKERLLSSIRADGFRPWLVIDDRSAVVAFWRKAGLCCLQCAPGDF